MSAELCTSSKANTVNISGVERDEMALKTLQDVNDRSSVNTPKETLQDCISCD